jgi:hypothetical protein
MLSVAGAAVAWGSAVASAAAPWGADPASMGYIGLCNAQGQQITSGNITTAPFAWRAVSTAPANGAYAGPSRTSILFVYQPIDGLAPSDWSGDSLTASSRYSNPAAPMAAATARDESLAQYMVEFKPKWDGYLQLRMYLGADNEQPYADSYPTLDIKVKGDTWRAVDGGPVNCASGTAVSIESLLLPSTSSNHGAGGSTSAPTSSSAGTGSSSGTGSSAGTGTASSGAGTHPASTVTHPDGTVAGAATAAASRSAPAGSTSSGAWVGAAALVLVALGFVFGLSRRRARSRRRTLEDATVPAAPSDGPPLATATKGPEK